MPLNLQLVESIAKKKRLSAKYVIQGNVFGARLDKDV